MNFLFFEIKPQIFKFKNVQDLVFYHMYKKNLMYKYSLKSEF